MKVKSVLLLLWLSSDGRRFVTEENNKAPLLSLHGWFAVLRGTVQSRFRSKRYFNILVMMDTVRLWKTSLSKWVVLSSSSTAPVDHVCVCVCAGSHRLQSLQISRPGHIVISDGKVLVHFLQDRWESPRPHAHWEHVQNMTDAPASTEPHSTDIRVYFILDASNPDVGQWSDTSLLSAAVSQYSPELLMLFKYSIYIILLSLYSQWSDFLSVFPCIFV